jgi:hypothetical protein
MAKAKPPLVRWALFRKQTKPAVSFQATAFSSPNWAPFPATLPGWSSRFQAPWGGILDGYGMEVVDLAAASHDL